MKISEMKQKLADSNNESMIPVMYGLARISQISQQQNNNIAEQFHELLHIPIGDARMLLHTLYQNQTATPTYIMNTKYEPIIFELWGHLVVPDAEGFIFGSVNSKLLADFKHYIVEDLKWDITRSENDSLLQNVKNEDSLIAMHLLQHDLDEWLEHFFATTEGSPMSVDKASFARTQLIKSFETGQVQPLSVEYSIKDQLRMNIKDPSKPTYWSSQKVKDTDELLTIMHSHLFM